MPFKLKDISALRLRLQMESRVRELALFNLGIDSKLRGCDLVSLRVRDICHGDQVASRAVVTPIARMSSCPGPLTIRSAAIGQLQRAALSGAARWLLDAGIARLNDVDRGDLPVAQGLQRVKSSDRNAWQPDSRLSYGVEGQLPKCTGHPGSKKAYVSFDHQTDVRR